jgi:hypothetical protein
VLRGRGRRPAGLRRRAEAERRTPVAGADASWRRADPGPEVAPDRADPMGLVLRPPGRPPGRAPASGTGGRHAAVPGARSAAGTAGQASARRSPDPRSSGPRSRGPRSWGRCPARRSAGSRQRGSPAVAGSAPAAGACASGPAGGGPAGAAFLRGAAAAGRTRRRRHRPARSGPRRCPPGRRGVHPGVFAWASHRHRGPGRCRHVPPGTSWAGHPAAPQDMPYLTSVGREKSPVGPRRSIVTNCT